MALRSFFPQHLREAPVPKGERTYPGTWVIHDHGLEVRWLLARAPGGSDPEAVIAKALDEPQDDLLTGGLHVSEFDRTGRRHARGCWTFSTATSMGDAFDLSVPTAVTSLLDEIQFSTGVAWPPSADQVRDAVSDCPWLFTLWNDHRLNARTEPLSGWNVGDDSPDYER